MHRECTTLKCDKCLAATLYVRGGRIYYVNYILVFYLCTHKMFTHL